MALRQAILGFLTVEGMTGYEFAKEFQDSVGSVWSAPHSQIYRELRKMEEEGLVAGAEVARGSASKRRYTITAAGRAEFVQWLQDPLMFPAERDAHRLQALYFDMIPGANARQHFEEHIRYWEQRQVLWQDRRDAIASRRLPLLRRRLEHRPAAEHEAIVEFKAHAFDGQIARAKSEIAWGRRGLALLERLEAPVD